MNTAIEHTELEAEAGTLLAEARSFSIATAEDAQKAADFLREVNGLKKRINDHFEPLRKASYDAYQAVLTSKADHLKPVESAEKTLKVKIGEWQAAEDARRAKEMQAAQEQAEAEERQRREAEAEQLRADAAAAKRAGDQQQADELRATARETLAAPVVVAVTAPAPVAKPTGVSTSYVYDFTITEPHLIPREYLVPDEVAIRRVVKALKDRTNIPGVQVTKKPSVSVRG